VSYSLYFAVHAPHNDRGYSVIGYLGSAPDIAAAETFVAWPTGWIGKLKTEMFVIAVDGEDARAPYTPRLACVSQLLGGTSRKPIIETATRRGISDGWWVRKYKPLTGAFEEFIDEKNGFNGQRHPETLLRMAICYGVDGRLVVMAACALLRMVIDLVNVATMHEVIDVVEAWTRGEKTVEDVDAAEGRVGPSIVGRYGIRHILGISTAVRCMARLPSEPGSTYSTDTLCHEVRLALVDSIITGVNNNEKEDKAHMMMRAVVRSYIDVPNYFFRLMLHRQLGSL